MTRPPYLLAIDAGTGSCRAVLFGAAAEQVGWAGREWTHHEPPGVPGGQEFDVAANWALIAACVAEVLAETGTDARDVAAVASTSMREGIVLYDEAGKELWACPNVDSRAVSEAEELVRGGEAQRIYDEAGDWVSITSPPRLRWLARHRPELFERVGGLSMISDWILFRLCGRQVTEPSAGSSSGMFDLAGRRWSSWIPGACGLRGEVLPPVVAPGSVVGSVTSEAAAQTGLRIGTPVVAGGADTQLGLLGSGIRPGTFTVVGGSFWQQTVLLDRPLIDPRGRLRTLCHVLPGQWMLEAIGFYCGLSMRWYRDAFCEAERQVADARGVDAYTVMEEAAAAVPAGSNGLVAILSNVMNARRWVHASPSFLGYDTTDPEGSGRAAGVRAIEEAAAFVVRGHRDIVAELTGLTFEETVFTGGAAKGLLWPQILADVLGLPVHVPYVKESSALGAALCAGVGVGLYPDIARLPVSLAARERTFAPQPDAVAAYDRAYDRWKRVYDAVLPLSEQGVLRPLWRAAGADALA
jgi:autoinducer 2 (AI-2) kinase